MPFDSPSNEPKVYSSSSKTKNQSPSLPIHQTTKLKTTKNQLGYKTQQKKNQSVFK
jgi:hypothetical protein